MTPGAPAPPIPPAPEAVVFPLSWLLATAIPPLQYRAGVEVARLTSLPPAFSAMPYAYRPALLLALQQGGDGTWNRAMLAVPGARAEGFEGIGTMAAVRRLLEYGWDRESPPLVRARRVLFRLLAEDEDPAFAFEMVRAGGMGAGDVDWVRHVRGLLRDAAAAVLAQAGYESDPRLRGAARRALERVDGYLRSPVAQKPFVRVGNQHVLSPGSAPPSIYVLMMLAHMPTFRSEHYDIMERLYAHLTQPVPRALPAVLVGRKVVEEPRLVLGDPLPHRNAADTDVPSALFWLEILSRLGLLRRNEGWSRLFDRFLDDRDEGGVWRVPKRSIGLRSASPFVWPVFPLDPHPTAEGLSAEVTFRIGLIARHLGRPIEVV